MDLESKLPILFFFFFLWAVIKELKAKYLIADNSNSSSKNYVGVTEKEILRD